MASQCSLLAFAHASYPKLLRIRGSANPFNLMKTFYSFSKTRILFGLHTRVRCWLPSNLLKPGSGWGWVWLKLAADHPYVPVWQAPEAAQMGPYSQSPSPSPSLSQHRLLHRSYSHTKSSHFYMQTSLIDMSKTVQISATFSTISSRLDSFGSWPYQGLPPKQLAVHGFYQIPGEKDDPIACFSCGKEWYYGHSTKMITDKELLGYHHNDCLWADMRREIMADSSLTTARPTNHSVVTGPPQQ
jgi:hypothetical protein